MEHTEYDVKRGYIEKMGELLGTVFYALWVETVQLHVKWDEYVELYGTKPERIDLLNKTAAEFFGAVQNMMWEDTLLHISRLTSAPKSAGRSNLTIKQLPPLIDDSELRIEVRALINEAVAKAESAKDWRNRHIAHTDFDLATDKGATLAFASRKTVTESIEAIANVLRAIALRLLDTDMRFDDVITMGRTALHLLQVLDDGVRIADQRHARIEAGKSTDEDLQWLTSRGKI